MKIYYILNYRIVAENGNHVNEGNSHMDYSAGETYRLEGDVFPKICPRCKSKKISCGFFPGNDCVCNNCKAVFC